MTKPKRRKPNGRKPYEKWLVIPDLQVPFHDEKTLKAVEAYMGVERWDGVIYLGDLIDFNEISRWTEDSPRQRQLQTVRKSFDATDEIITRHLAIVRGKNPKAKFVVLEGNHEYRIEALVDKYEYLEGMLEVDQVLRFKERRIQWVRCWSRGEKFKKGKAWFTHGLYLNKYHAFKMCDTFGVNIFYGHTHDVQSYSHPQFGKGKTLRGQSLGNLCREDMRYILGRPNNWTQAITAFYFFPDGYFQYNIMEIYKHRFVGTDGVVYDGRKL